MRIAVLILGIPLGAIMAFQSFVFYGLANALNKTGSSQSGAIGIFMAILWLVACAFVIPAPLVSVIVFVAAGLLGFSFSSNFSDLSIWGAASMVMAGLSVIGWVMKRRGDRRQDARHQELVTATTRATVAMPAIPFTDVELAIATGVVGCPACGARNPRGSRFCADCGSRLDALNAPA